MYFLALAQNLAKPSSRWQIFRCRRFLTAKGPNALNFFSGSVHSWVLSAASAYIFACLLGPMELLGCLPSMIFFDCVPSSAMNIADMVRPSCPVFDAIPVRVLTASWG